MKQLVAFDLDGTLAESKQQLTEPMSDQTFTTTMQMRHTCVSPK